MPWTLNAGGNGRWASRSFALLWAGLLGLYAVALNQLLYQQQEPLFDAISYLERMHRVMSLARRDGFAAGWHEATHHTTVTLPYLLALPLANWLEPARWIGIVIQTAGLAFFLLVFDRVLGAFGILHCGSRIVGLVSIGLLAALQFPNGGLSDFRMDLPLMLGYGATVGSLSVSLRSGLKRDWLATGLCGAACALVRATAPVYVLLATGPVVLAHLVRASPSRRWTILAGSSIAAFFAVLAAGWFYFINAGYLQFYYTVWNTDANARLPWSEALGHIKLCGRQLGWAWLGGLAAIGCLARFWNVTPFRVRPAAESQPVNTTDHFPRDWLPEFAWFALVPLGMLIGLRAGLNPFVSMPAAIAAAMACGTLLGHFHQRLPAHRARIVVGVTMLFVLVALGKGWWKHACPNHRQMPEHRAVVAAIIEDAWGHGLGHVRFASLQTCDLQTESLWNCILFDVPEASFEGNEAFVHGIRLEPDRLFFRPSQVDWDSVPGSYDEARCRWLVGQCHDRIGYLIVPDAESVTALERAAGKDVVNRHVGRLAELIVKSGRWSKVAGFRCADNGRGYGLFRCNDGLKLR